MKVMEREREREREREKERECGCVFRPKAKRLTDPLIS